MDVMTSHTALLKKVLAVQGVSLDNNFNHFRKAQKYLNFPRNMPFWRLLVLYSRHNSNAL